MVFTEVFSIEVERDNIKVILVCPGKTITAFKDNLLYHEGLKNSKFKGMPADAVAKEILSAVEKNRKFVIIGMSNKIFYMLDKLFPNLTDKLLKWMEEKNII